ncbi:MAG TPA: MBL fold metallo-hydrolase, partial [Planctomycetota bacterium]
AQRLAEALEERHLDLLVVTHADQDHHNGVPALLRRLSIDTAILPGRMRASELASLLAAHGTRVHVLAGGERLEPAPHLRLAMPSVPEGASDNDQSLWTSVQMEGARVLLTGDAEELGVATAIAEGLATQSDVLVLPHHGRPNAMLPALLQCVRPRACFASAATADGDTVLGRIARRSGAELWVTGQHGTITLTGLPAQVTGSAGSRPLSPRRQ